MSRDAQSRQDHTRQEQARRDLERIEREREKLEKNLGGIKNTTRLPGAVFVIDPKKEALAVHEANRLGIPVIGLVDTHCDPEGIDYVIPGNDDSAKAVTLYARGIADAVLEGRANAEDDVVKAVASEGTDEFVEVNETGA